MRFGQPLHTPDIHALIRPLAAQCVQTDPRPDIPNDNGSFIITTGKPAPIEAKGYRPHLPSVFKEGLEGVCAARLLDMPQLDGMIIVTIGQHCSVPAKCRRPDPVQSALALDHLEAVPAAHIPYSHGHVAAAEKPFSIWAEGECSYGAGGSAQCLETLSTPHLPQLDLPIIIAACQQAPIGAEGQRPDKGAVPSQGREIIFALLCAHLPELYGMLKAGAGQHTAVGTEGKRPDDRRMSVESLEVLPATSMPELDAQIIPAADKGLSIRAKADRPDASRVAAVKGFETASTAFFIHFPQLSSSISHSLSTPLSSPWTRSLPSGLKVRALITLL